MTKNKNSTRYYSALQEQEVAEVVEGHRQPNSGAGYFNKGDVINERASLLVECKCSVKEKDSFSIKKEWIEKNKMEMRQLNLSNHCIAFNFAPDTESYYIIDRKLMTYLVDKLQGDFYE